jgi:hypothetical protein
MKHLLAIIVACSLVTSAFAQGNFEGITSTSGASASGLFSGTAGWAFQAATSFEVAELGVFDYLLQETPIGPVTVGLWAENGTLLASADVSNSSPLVNQSRYSSIAPVLLTGGQTYFLGAFRSTGFTINVFGPGMGPGSAFATTLNIQYLGLASNTNAAFAIPQLEPGGGSLLYAGPNFRVPEPSSFALMALGVAGFALYRRVRK